ncbi:MAG: hypothetical protein IH944_02340 [Armatimonadetes bacterium]|nr:hypothetical protein [Armatimonadota bacterium]
MEVPGRQSRKSATNTLPILCIAFIVIIVILTVVFQQKREFRSDVQDFEILTVVGFTGLLAGLGFAQSKLRPRSDSNWIEDVSPAKFQQDMIISLALIELCALLGIFVVQNQTMSTVMPVAAIVAMSLFVLPLVLQYTKVVKGH